MGEVKQTSTQKCKAGRVKDQQIRLNAGDMQILVQVGNSQKEAMSNTLFHAEHY